MDQALAVVEQRVELYGDTITVRAQGGDVYVPLRPICDLLGVNWSAQRRRILRDAVLVRKPRCGVTTTPSGSGAGGGKESRSLPLDYDPASSASMPTGSSRNSRALINIKWRHSGAT